MTQAWRKQWVEEGYLVIPGVFDAARTERLRRICESAWSQFLVCDPQKGVPGTGKGGDPDCMRHLNHPDYFKDRPSGHFTEFMDAIADELVLGIARSILGEPALFRCTSFWHNPARRMEDGSWHRDLQFLHGDEAVERHALEQALKDGESGIQMQIALVASDDVEYVPRSHLRWDTPEEYAIRAANNRINCRSNAMPGALRIALQPGDAALFNPNGLHRGRYHADKARRTLMLTYTQTSTPLADYFTDQPWFLEPDYLAPLSPRTRSFFEPFIATFRSQWTAAAVTTGKY